MAISNIWRRFNKSFTYLNKWKYVFSLRFVASFEPFFRFKGAVHKMRNVRIRKRENVVSKLDLRLRSLLRLFMGYTSFFYFHTTLKFCDLAQYINPNLMLKLFIVNHCNFQSKKKLRNELDNLPWGKEIWLSV